MASKYAETGVSGITAAGDNTRTRQPGAGPTGGGADGSAMVTVTERGDVINNIDRAVDRIMGREGRPGINENDQRRSTQERERVGRQGNNRNR